MKKILTLLICFLALSSFAQKVEPTWESLNQRAYPQWFSDAKLGIFIHWGVYSVPAFATNEGYAEWYYSGLMNGATLNFTMSDEPNKTRGTQEADYPYSFSTDKNK